MAESTLSHDQMWLWPPEHDPGCCSGRHADDVCLLQTQRRGEVNWCELKIVERRMLLRSGRLRKSKLAEKCSDWSGALRWITLRLKGNLQLFDNNGSQINYG